MLKGRSSKRWAESGRERKANGWVGSSSKTPWDPRVSPLGSHFHNLDLPLLVNLIKGLLIRTNSFFHGFFVLLFFFLLLLFLCYWFYPCFWLFLVTDSFWVLFPLGVCLKDSTSYCRDTCSTMLIAALFLIARIEHMSINRYMAKENVVHYPAVKKIHR